MSVNLCFSVLNAVSKFSNLILCQCRSCLISSPLSFLLSLVTKLCIPPLRLIHTVGFWAGGLALQILRDVCIILVMQLYLPFEVFGHQYLTQYILRCSFSANPCLAKG